MARQFDYDTSDYLYDTSNSGLVAAHPITVALWFYCDELPSTHGGEYCFVHLSYGLDSEKGLYVRIEDSGGNANKLEATLHTPLQEMESVSTIIVSNQTWQHACGVFTSTTLRECYLDGGNKGSDVVEAIDSYVPDETFIGAWNYNDVPRDFPEAKMAELGIWNAALTAAEVATLAAGYSPLFVRPQNLVQYLPFIRDDIDRMGTVSLSTGGNPGFASHAPIIYPAPPFISFPSAAAGGATVTLTKVAMTLTGKSLFANRVNPLVKVATTATGKDIYFAKANTLSNISLTLTGKDIVANKVNNLAKVVITLTGKNVTALTTGLVTLIKVAMTITGKVLAVNKINALTKVAIVATGKSLFANTVGVLTKVVMTLTGKNVALNKLNNLAKGTLTLTGKAVTVLGGVVGKAVHRFFDFF